MLSSLPLYMLLVQFGISRGGAVRVHVRAPPAPLPAQPLWLALAYLPYQWLLAFAALRAVWRQARGENSWEKTAHVGAHRQPASAAGGPARRAGSGRPWLAWPARRRRGGAARCRRSRAWPAAPCSAETALVVALLR